MERGEQRLLVQTKLERLAKPPSFLLCVRLFLRVTGAEMETVCERERQTERERHLLPPFFLRRKFGGKKKKPVKYFLGKSISLSHFLDFGFFWCRYPVGWLLWGIFLP